MKTSAKNTEIKQGTKVWFAENTGIVARVTKPSAGSWATSKVILTDGTRTSLNSVWSWSN